ncbi:MAG: FG-GAP repeat protein, partial [Candidatus Hydrogenedentes bacterium]|nr:FG-GAP repeat protein [Candidatus Hydrogenedentota bacterium]
MGHATSVGDNLQSAICNSFILCLTILLYSTFAEAQTFARSGKSYQVGPNPTAIAVADLNDDGFPDIVTANTGTMSDPRQERPANDEVSVLMS